jgi:hypothetical protein
MTAPGRLRAQIEGLSRPLLIWLVGLPRAVPLVATVIFLLSALFLPLPWAALGPLLVLALSSWLLVLSWPRLPRAARLGRLAILSLLTAICLVQALGE